MKIQLDFPHRRYNPLTGDWVLVSPHRARRPWLGQVEKTPTEHLPAYDPACYLCPGNPRAGGHQNPDYHGTFVFDNDFAALLTPEQAAGLRAEQGVPIAHHPGNPSHGRLVEETPNLPRDSEHAALHSLFQTESANGICRVVCFSPQHDLSLPELSQVEVEAVITTWTEQWSELGTQDWIRYVQVFENKGAMMGASNPHPHSQIWASSYLPNEPDKELRAAAEYRRQHDTCLLCDYLAAEKAAGERLVTANEHFSALVPFWAVWPFEILLISNRHLAAMPDFTPAEVSALADLLRRVTARYDNLFEVSFPYSMGFHQAPTDSGLEYAKKYPDVHFHAHFYPPLLRSATVRKFMVGYEMLAMPQRDLTPETAAERLRGLSEAHYRQGGS
jgi:UDPglucose--hexose-1-phosphate uridylyltransferase